MVMKYRKSLFASIIMIVCGTMLFVIIPIMMSTAASYVDTSEGADNSWWRTVWYIGLALGYTAYILMIGGVLLMVITVLRELSGRKKNKQKTKKRQIANNKAK
jgi:TRAP-type C4-dicarboxylate transport system permease small subunit